MSSIIYHNTSYHTTLGQPLILNSASSIILVHNHPSGECDPSVADLDLTKKLVEAGELLGINVLDHVIIGESYLSFRENGYM